MRERRRGGGVRGGEGEGEGKERRGRGEGVKNRR